MEMGIVIQALLFQMMPEGLHCHQNFVSALHVQILCQGDAADQLDNEHL